MNEATCPLCGDAKRMKSAKLLYGHPVCKKCHDGFANRRHFAFIIDSILWRMLMIPIAATALKLFGLSGINVPNINYILGYFLLFVFFYKDALITGQSPGKALFGIKVVDQTTGQPIGFGTSFKRNVPLYIPFMPLIVAFQLGKGHRYGDGWSNSKVIWKKYSSHPIFSTGTDESAPVNIPSSVRVVSSFQSIKKLVLIVFPIVFLLVAAQVFYLLHQAKDDRLYDGVWKARQERNFTAALDECQKLIQQRPNDDAPYSQCASIYDELKHHQKAIEFYSKAIEKKPAEPSHLVQRGLARQRYGDFGGAISDFNQALDMSPQTDSKSGTLPFGLSKKIAGPMHHSKRAALSHRGNAFRESGSYNEAVSDFSKVLELLDDEQSSGLFNEMQKKAKAPPTFVSFNDRDRAEALVNRGRVYFEMGDLQKAVEDFTKAAEKAHNNGDAYFNRAKVLRVLGQTSEAEKDFSQAINYYTAEIEDTFNQHFYGAYRYVKRANAYLEIGKNEAAFKDFKDATKLQQDTIGGIYAAYMASGQARLKSDDSASAIADFSEALKLCPYDPIAYLYLGQSHAKAGNSSEGLQNYSKAIELRLFYPEALYERGAFRLSKGERGVGIQDLNEVVKKTNSSLEVHKKATALLNRNAKDESVVEQKNSKKTIQKNRTNNRTNKSSKPRRRKSK